ncbi:hypothetical protein [Paenibacillus sp. GCM10012303]|uniref:hypothetical protein n=1 Tax=Paenibacillus sp. GCM10012303 TaxID=3317340 RepID=UPI00361C5D12
MLPLSDPLWRELRGPYGSSEEVPLLLTRLQEQYDAEDKDKLYWEHLYHQNTLYSCTYAAVPYLAVLAHNTDNPETKLDIYIQCGIFEANNGNGPENEVAAEYARDGIQVSPETAQDIYRSYRKAVAGLAALGPTLIDYVRSEQPESEKRYFLAAAAAYAGSKAAACMLLTFSGGDEYVFGCSECGEDVYLWPEEPECETLIVYKDDPVNEPDQPGSRIERREPETMEDGGFRVLYRQAELVGDATMLHHLPELAGDTDCPHCGVRQHIWPGLLRIFNG